MTLNARAVAFFAIASVLGTFGCGNSQTGRTRSVSASTAAPATSSTTTTPTISIASLSTSSSPIDGGAPVTITGSGFAAAGDTLVLFGTQGAKTTPVSDTRIDVVVPASTTAGTVDVRVVNAHGAGVLAGAFTYVPHAASLAFAPAVGHYEIGQAGTKITLALKDFAAVTSASAVTFGSTKATAVAALDSKTLVAEVPNGVAAGHVTITVEENGQRVSAPGFLVQGALNYGDLTINEVCPNPSGFDCNRDGTRSSSGDEFVELVNTTSEYVDLSYLTFYDSTSTERHRFPNPTTLPPHGAIVVFGAGCPEGFAPRHQTGSAQTATSGMLALSNASDTIELRTLPGTSIRGTTLFLLNYTNAPVGSSLTNVHDGQAITRNPATIADYVPHSTAPGAKDKISPGKRVDGSDF